MSIEGHRNKHDQTPDADVPGGPALNRAATVATSAALGAAATGALVGSVAGPVGTAVGAVIGAIAAGVGGNAIAESIDVEAENAYWRENYRQRPYVDTAASFEDYGPAYDFGVASAITHADRNFEQAEVELSQGWASSRGASRLEWERARQASLDGWSRVRTRQQR